jgi:GNAT superfamily N-acetyltransferase
MKRYSGNSEIKKLKILRSKGSEPFYAEIIKNTQAEIKGEKREEFLKEISGVVEKAWGKFPKEYLENSILHSRYLLLLRTEKEKLIGVAPIKKIHLDGRYVYSFGLTAVDPDYQGLGFMKKMHTILGRRIFVENLIKLKTSVEFVFITPNIRTIGALAKVADFIYPNPYAVDEAGNIDYADDKTWETINLYLKATGETFRKLDRCGDVMIGFYDDKPNLILKENDNIPDKKLRIFAKHYLKPGNEIVSRAIVSIWGLLRSDF